MKKILITVNGFARCGKDTFMDAIVAEARREGKSAEKHSAVQTVKSVFYLMGWDGVKTPMMRNGLSDLNDIYIKYFDGPYKEVINLVETCDIVCATAREPVLLERFKNYAKMNEVDYYSVLIRSPREETQHTNHSDKNVLEYDYDFLFQNEGTKEDFEFSVQGFYYHLTHGTYQHI